MSHLFATNGAKVYIGDAMAFDGTDFVAGDFSSVTWVEIGGVTNLGQAGDTSELITSNHIGAGRTRKLKGTRNAGSQEIVADLDYADTGQIALLAAEKTDDTYAIKVELNDAPSGGTPSIRYYVALIMSATEVWNEANSVMQISANLEIDSNIVKVAAAGA
ncbi:MAG: hypothetical protein KDJ36_11550 [Hyphomicrobiaceae bacterium]|nr:hypothetical protein [Hyphomicrobiaceae bacterium]